MQINTKNHNPWTNTSSDEPQENDDVYFQQAVGIGINAYKKGKNSKNQMSLNDNSTATYRPEPRYNWESSSKKTSFDTNKETKAKDNGAANKTGSKVASKGTSKIASKGASKAGNIFSDKAVEAAGETTASAAATSAGSAADAAASTTPYTLIIKEALKIAKKTLDEVRHNLQRHSTSGKDENGPFGSGVTYIALGIGVFLILITSIFPVMMIAPLGGFVTGTSDYILNLDTPIVSVAITELKNASNNIGGEKYKDWYGSDADWGSMFVSWCANKCGYIEDGTMPKTHSGKTMQKWYKSRGRWKEVKNDNGTYVPDPGDIVFLKSDNAVHTGIVISVDDDRPFFQTIEGNTGSSSTNPYHKGSTIKEKEYSWINEKIIGYAKPNYKIGEIDWKKIYDLIFD